MYGYNIGEWSTDTFLALPVTSLGTEHRVVSMTSSEHQGAPPSQMAIVANRSVVLIHLLADPDGTAGSHFGIKFFIFMQNFGTN